MHMEHLKKMDEKDEEILSDNSRTKCDNNSAMLQIVQRLFAETQLTSGSRENEWDRQMGQNQKLLRKREEQFNNLYASLNTTKYFCLHSSSTNLALAYDSSSKEVLDSYNGINRLCVREGSVLVDCTVDTSENLKKFLEDYCIGIFEAKWKKTMNLDQVEVSAHSIHYEELKIKLLEQLKQSRWNQYNVTSLKPIREDLTWEQAKQQQLTGFRYINTKYVPLDALGKPLKDTRIITADNSLQSYHWVQSDFQALDLPDQLKINLQYAHLGYSVCRKLAFDPVHIDLAAGKLF